MGCGASTAKPPPSSAKYASSEAEAPEVAEAKPVQAGVVVGPGAGMGHHWAESSPDGKERRTAEKPWQQPSTPGASKDGELVAECAECAPTETGEEAPFEYKQTFPMMVMHMSTFLELKVMQNYEELIVDKKVFQWTPDMGDRVFFLSHQWTSFSHPDPLGEQLRCAQQVLRTIEAGKLRDIFATEEEYNAYFHKEANRFMNFSKVTPEKMAEEVKNGFVWLDFASVPQSREAEEQRLNAIDSIPSYVDHALAFIALVPRVEHKDLPGVFCDYKSWMERGWCRLETQVHELRLFETRPGELMPGVPNLDIPRRPLIVHSGCYATTYDVFDNFYMLWQRKNTVFTGEFACCRLGHKRKMPDGTELTWPCDKARIKPLVKGLWERKIAHMKTMAPVIHFMFAWRWISHYHLMMAEDKEDCGDTDHAEMGSVEAMMEKYNLGDEYHASYAGFIGMMKMMMGSHPSFAADRPDGAETWAKAVVWMDKWAALVADKKKLFEAFAIGFAVAEGNLPLVKKLHEEDGVPLDYGFMWGITLLDFASGKGHLRTMRYLLEHDKSLINKPSFRERISAVDRACKAGFADALDLLVEHGGDVHNRRLNNQVPAHGAAIWGHAHVLRRLHELGADVLGAVDDKNMAPLDYAEYFCQAEAREYLRGLGGEGYQTAYEKQNEAATKIQAIRRGKAARAK